MAKSKRIEFKFDERSLAGDSEPISTPIRCSQPHFDTGRKRNRRNVSIEVRRHVGATMWIEDLLIDLDLSLAGIEPTRPITQERLEEWERYRANLEDCLQRVEVPYTERLP